MKFYSIDGFDAMLIALGGVILFVIALFLAFIIFLILYNTLTQIIERLSFFSKLKIACRGESLKCEKRHSLLRSFFNSYEGSDFIIYKDDKELFHLKFFPYFIRRKINVLDDNGVLEMRFRTFHWRRVSYVEGMHHDRNLYGFRWFFYHVNVFKRHRITNLAFDKTDADRIILIPGKHTLLTFFVGTQRQAVDNGVEFTDGARFYDQKAFLNKLDKERGG